MHCHFWVRQVPVSQRNASSSSSCSCFSSQPLPSFGVLRCAIIYPRLTSNLLCSCAWPWSPDLPVLSSGSQTTSKEVLSPCLVSSFNVLLNSCTKAYHHLSTQGREDSGSPHHDTSLKYRYWIPTIASPLLPPASALSGLSSQSFNYYWFSDFEMSEKSCHPLTLRSRKFLVSILHQEIKYRTCKIAQQTKGIAARLADLRSRAGRREVASTARPMTSTSLQWYTHVHVSVFAYTYNGGRRRREWINIISKNLNSNKHEQTCIIFCCAGHWFHDFLKGSIPFFYGKYISVCEFNPELYSCQRNEWLFCSETGLNKYKGWI